MMRLVYATLRALYCPSLLLLNLSMPDKLQLNPRVSYRISDRRSRSSNPISLLNQQEHHDS
jgi:hypothetical protein